MNRCICEDLGGKPGEVIQCRYCYPARKKRNRDLPEDKCGGDGTYPYLEEKAPAAHPTMPEDAK